MQSNQSPRKSRQRERLILALLEQPSLSRAAEAAGMSYPTAWRITKTPEFCQEYAAARRDSFAQAIARLQHGSGPAASGLLKVLNDPGTKDRDLLRAADSILNHGLKAMAYDELQTRIERLEELVKGKHSQIDKL
jgi:hypothetical protein